MTDQMDAALVWFRRDLRCDDHAALYYALKSAKRVWCAFILDTDILDALPRQDRRVSFILRSLEELNDGLQRLAGKAHAGLIVRHGSATMELPKLAAQLGVQGVFANHDDDPFALERDAKVRGKLSDLGAALYTSKDHVIFERNEILTGQHTPYGVFTPYKNAWLKKLDAFYMKAYPIAPYAQHLAPIPADMTGWQVGAPTVPYEEDIGFEPCDQLKVPTGMSGAQELLNDFLPRMQAYAETRDFPSVKGPSYLSTHLRFGTVSIRQLANLACNESQSSNGAQIWLSELIWRDFYHQVLFHHPHVVGHSYRREYDKIKWAQGAHAQALFKAWCQGETGYPLVDAAMRQINQTGYMHNRLRMVTASFLTKDLGIDWRKGEAYFAEKLLDYDLAANNGGWQWAASTGCDAQPYFRIFNPISQSKKFDPAGKFIRRYVPELADLPDSAIHAPWLGGFQPKGYPKPIVDHDEARAQTLKRFEVVKKA